MQTMKCPVCRTGLEFQEIADSGLPVHRCPSCQGQFLSANEYLRWVRARGQDLPATQAVDAELPTWDSQDLKVCPACAHAMLRYRVIAHAPFHLDRCGHCNGVWLDKDEWDALAARNLHDNIHEFFTQAWQIRLRAEEARAALDRLYLQKFGEDDYAQAKQVREWLSEHPRRGMLLAFLQADDPYRV